MRKAASGGDAAFSQRDRRRALHVVPNGSLKSAPEWSSSMVTKSIKEGKSLIREHITSAPAPDPRESPHHHTPLSNNSMTNPLLNWKSDVLAYILQAAFLPNSL
jgi:hypothetical protein